MADALDSHNIARHAFEVGRRGYEQQEVRAFLHEVSSHVDRLQRENAELRERAERAEARLGLAEDPDEAMLLEVLGEETTRVLTSAREAAAEIRTKAEAAAERIIGEATSEAADTRAEAVREADRRLAEAAAESETVLAAARTELERRSAEAEEAAAQIRAAASAEAQALRDDGQRDLERIQAEGEAELQAARGKGRDMVAEAQAVRERVLRDLAVRRKKARQQVEKLNAGRERLLRAYDVVRRTIDEATDELSTSLSDARLAADAAARRIAEEPDPTIEQLDEEAATAGLIDLPAPDFEEGEDEPPGPFSGEVPVVDPAAPVPEEAAPVAADPPAPVEAPTVGDAPVDLDARRGRKGRRRKSGGFEGLPPGELTRVEPTAEGEGVRILAEPAAEADESEESPNAEADGADPAAEPDAPESLDVDHGAEPAEPVEDDRSSAGTAAEPVVEDDQAEAAEPVEALAGDDQPPGADPSEPTEVDSQEADPEAEAPEPEAEEPTVAADAPAVAAGGEAPPAVEDLFARLRAEQGDEPGDETAPAADEVDVEPAADPEPAPDGEPSVFRARDTTLEPLDKELSRRLKRALADEQNEVLDLLRRAKPKGVDDLLPPPDDHAARWAGVVAGILGDAAAAGAEQSEGSSGSVADLAAELAQMLTAPLRDRIDRSFAASDGNLDDVTDRVRALYREWKGKRLTDTSRHYAAAAYARGMYDGLPKGSEVRWSVDPLGGPCPDCDDNALARAIAKGTEFPTGHLCAPAHPGCRCLVVAADA